MGAGPDVRLPLWLLRASGLWPPPSPSPSPTATRVYGVYTALVLTAMTVGNGTLLGGAARASSYQAFSFVVTLMMQLVACAAKSWEFVLRQRGRCRRLLALTASLPAPPPGSEGARALAAASRQGNAVAVVYTAMGFVAYVFWLNSPLLVVNPAAEAECRQRLLQRNVTEQIEEECIARYLPTQALYPFDHTKNPMRYTGAYMFQGVFTFYCYINTNTLDCLYVALMLHTAAHLRALAERLRTAADARSIMACVRYHEHICACARELQGLLGVSALIQFVAALAVICFSLFTINSATEGRFQFGAYFATMVMEVLLFCWYGEEVRAASEELRRAAYEAPWPAASATARYATRFILLRTHKTMGLETAGGFNQLSRATFLSLIQRSYSFYAVLSSMEE